MKILDRAALVIGAAGMWLYMASVEQDRWSRAVLSVAIVVLAFVLKKISRMPRGAGRTRGRAPKPCFYGVDPHRIIERMIQVLLTERIVLSGAALPDQKHLLHILTFLTP